MVAIPVCVIGFIHFRTHLWLNFDLKAAAEPTGLLKRWPCDPAHRLEDPLCHLLHNNVAISIPTLSLKRSLAALITAAASQPTCRSLVSFLFSRLGSLLTKSLRILQDRKSPWISYFFKGKWKYLTNRTNTSRKLTTVYVITWNMSCALSANMSCSAFMSCFVAYALYLWKLTPAVRSGQVGLGWVEQTPVTDWEEEQRFPAEPVLKYYTQKQRSF